MNDLEKKNANLANLQDDKLTYGNFQIAHPGYGVEEYPVVGNTINVHGQAAPVQDGEIWAEVFTRGTAIPVDPSASSTQCTFRQTTNYFFADNVPLAETSGNPNTEFQLVVWKKEQDSVVAILVCLFKGTDSTRPTVELTVTGSVGNVVTVSAEFSKPVNGMIASDFKLWNGTADSGTFTGVPGDTTYTIKVTHNDNNFPFSIQILDEAAQSAFMPIEYNLASNLLHVDPISPNAPTLLSATVNGSDINLAWTVSTTSGVTEQRIYRRTDATTYALKATINDTTAAWTDIAPTEDVEYFYIVRAYKVVESADSNEVSATVVSGGATLIADGFSGPNGDSLSDRYPDGTTTNNNIWNVNNGTWEVQGTKMRLSSLYGNNSDIDCENTNISVEADITLPSSGPISQCSLVVRYLDTSNHWFIALRNDINTVSIREYNGGTQTERASTGMTITNGTTYNLKVAVDSSDDFEVWVDDFKIPTYNNSLHNTRTKVGLHGYITGGYDAEFEDFLVKENP